MANLQRMTTKRLGEIFTHSGLITPEQLEETLADQQKSGKHLGEMLVERGYVTERDVAEAIATQFSLPYLSPTQYFAPSEMSGLVPTEVLVKHQVVPIDKLGRILMIVIAGPVDNDVLERIEKDTGCVLQIYVGTITEVRTAIEKLGDSSKKTQEKDKKKP